MRCAARPGARPELEEETAPCRKYAAAIDQGTTSTRCIIFDLGGRSSVAQGEHEQIYPKPDGSSTTRWRSGPRRRSRRGPEAAGSDKAETRGRRHHEPARDDVVWDRATGEPVHNAIVWQDMRTDRLVPTSSRATAGRTASARTRGCRSRPTSPARSSRWMLDNVDGAPRARRGGRAARSGTIDTWLHLEPDRRHGRRRPRHRRDEREPHAADGPRDARLGRRAARRDRRPARDAARDPRVLRGLRRRRAGRRSTACRSPAILGDQQAALVRAGLLRAGEAKNTTAPAASCCSTPAPRPCRPSSGLLTTVAYKLGDEPRVYALEGSIAVTGALVQWLRDNLGMIKAAPEVEELARDRRGQRRRVLRAGVLGPVRAALASRRARRDRRPDRATSTRATSPARRSRRRPTRRREVLEAMDADSGVDARVAEGRRRHGAERAAHAVPGRHARRAGRAPGGRRDDGARRRLRRGPRGRASGASARTCARTGRRTSAGSPSMDSAKRDEYYKFWKKAVTRTFDWFEAEG